MSDFWKGWIIANVVIILAMAALHMKAGREPCVEPADNVVASPADLQTIADYVRDNCTYVSDHDQHGHMDYAQNCLITGKGDCEDFSMAFVGVFAGMYPHLAGKATIHVGHIIQDGELVGHAITLIGLPLGEFQYDSRTGKITPYKGGYYTRVAMVAHNNKLVVAE